MNGTFQTNERGTRIGYHPRLTEERVRQIASWVEWHNVHGCRVNHGAIIDIAHSDTNDVVRYLRHFYGCEPKKGEWWTKQPDGNWSVEFSDSIHGYYSKPWDFCGASILFEDWQERDKEYNATKVQFRVGDHVRFEHKGWEYHGVITGGRTRATVLVDHSKWNVPYTMLTKE